ncbi:MAG: hypothetical protein IJT51_00855 [Bacteroidales bacterium]|nr:hypothetical protein [Bacteroidales bacterium]
MIQSLQKYFYGFFYVAALTITLSACSKEEMQIRGSWIELSTSGTETTRIWVFNKDNSFVISGIGNDCEIFSFENRLSGHYEIDRNSLYIEADDIICDFIIVEINKSSMKLSGSIYNWNYDETSSGTLTFMRAK